MINNKRIAKNTLFLYIRMLLLLGISLYTSRLVLRILGFEDYGIYNIVGSVIVLFGFINSALTGATRRFLNFSLGKNNNDETKNTFSACFSIHVLIAVLIFILGETIGLWLLNTYLNIPEERLYAANWVYQFSIVSTCIGIIGVPFESTIVAYERMSIYAYISIMEGILKLLIVFLLIDSPFDKLIYYASLILLIGLLINGIKWFYCIKTFSICQVKLRFESKTFREILSFSGWSLFGQIAYIGSTTGLNMIINIFFGVILNAAMGIAQQVNTAIYNFVSNFQVAFNPQLIQSYSSGDMAAHRKLISRSSRLSYYLLFIIALPILANTDFILQIWLTDVPNKTAIFTQLIIIFSLIDAIGAPLWMSMQAIGRIKVYQIIISSINILNLPLAYLSLKYQSSAEFIFYIKIALGIVMYIFRIYYILPKILYSITDYFKDVLFPSLSVSIISGLGVYIISLYTIGVYKFFFTTIVSILLCGLSIYFLGINKEERNKISNILMKWIR